MQKVDWKTVKLNEYQLSSQSMEEYNPIENRRKRIEKYGFKSAYSSDLSIKLIDYAQENIDRIGTVIKIAPLLFSTEMAKKLELGIFEFALIHVTINNLDQNIITAIYNDKVADIMINLDKNSYVNNNTLLPTITSGAIDPQLIAFLSPQQLHPARWDDILSKKRYAEDAENNMATTDIYKCKKCGEKKSRITELQTRSADECSTKFITCMVCYNTFCIS
jgi:DNA-directed RNA polymerase subunit M/transcription elongation factor TFIIS